MKKINKKQLIDGLTYNIYELWDLSAFRNERTMIREIVKYVVNETLIEVEACQKTL